MFGTSLHHNGCYRITFKRACLFGARLQAQRVSGNRLGSGRRLRALARRPGPNRIVNNSSEELFKRPSQSMDRPQFFLDGRFQRERVEPRL